MTDGDSSHTCPSPFEASTGLVKTPGGDHRWWEEDPGWIGSNVVDHDMKEAL